LKEKQPLLIGNAEVKALLNSKLGSQPRQYFVAHNKYSRRETWSKYEVRNLPKMDEKYGGERRSVRQRRRCGQKTGSEKGDRNVSPAFRCDRVFFVAPGVPCIKWVFPARCGNRKRTKAICNRKCVFDPARTKRKNERSIR